MQTFGNYVGAANVVMRWHYQKRQLRLRRGIGRDRTLSFQRHKLACDSVRPERGDDVQLTATGSIGTTVSQVDDVPLCNAIDRRVGIVDEAGKPFGQPMVTARLLAFAIHALLNDGPFSVIGDDEPVQI